MFPKVVWPKNFTKRQKCLKKSKFKISKNLKHLNMVKMVKNHDFSDVVAEYGATRFFPEKRAVSPFIIYHGLTLCQKSKKSLERLSGKSDYPINNYSRYSSTDNVAKGPQVSPLGPFKSSQSSQISWQPSNLVEKWGEMPNAENRTFETLAVFHSSSSYLREKEKKT